MCCKCLKYVQRRMQNIHLIMKVSLYNLKSEIYIYLKKKKKKNEIFFFRRQEDKVCD